MRPSPVVDGASGQRCKPKDSAWHGSGATITFAKVGDESLTDLKTIKAKMHGCGYHWRGELLTSGALRRYIDGLSVTGLTSNAVMFDHAI